MEMFLKHSPASKTNSQKDTGLNNPDFQIANLRFLKLKTISPPLHWGHGVHGANQPPDTKNLSKTDIFRLPIWANHKMGVRQAIIPPPQAHPG